MKSNSDECQQCGDCCKPPIFHNKVRIYENLTRKQAAAIRKSQREDGVCQLLTKDNRCEINLKYSHDIKSDECKNMLCDKCN